MQDLSLDKLGPYPLLQLAGAIVVLIGLAITVYRAMRDRPSNSAPQIPPEQRWFFDGPLTVAVNLLRDCRNHLGRLVEIEEQIPKELRKQTELLRKIEEGLIPRRPRR
jgi:hypothetical protein